MNPILFALVLVASICVGVMLGFMLVGALFLLVGACRRWWRLAHPIVPDDMDGEREVRQVVRAPDPLSAIWSGPWKLGSERAAGSALICWTIRVESLSAGVYLVRWEFRERPEDGNLLDELMAANLPSNLNRGLSLPPYPRKPTMTT